MTNYICTYNDEKWNASYKIIEKCDKYSILSQTLSISLSYPDDEFWNYENLYHHTQDEIISKTIVKGISTYYKETI